MTMTSAAWIVALAVTATACSGKGEPAQPSPKEPATKGAHTRIVYDLDLDKAIDDRAATIRNDLQESIGARALTSITIGIDGMLTVTPSEPSGKPELERTITTLYTDHITMRECAGTAPPGAVCFKIAQAFGIAIKQAALAQAVKTIEARLVAVKLTGATVASEGERIVIELPGGDPARLDALRSLIPRSGTLEFKVVDHDSPFMQRVFAHVGLERGTTRATDEAAIAAGIHAEVDQWRLDDSGGVMADYYLVAADREERLPITAARTLGCRGAPQGDLVTCAVTGRAAIERYLADLARVDPSYVVPDDRQIGYEAIVADKPGEPRRWRSYYLERAAALTGAAIATATTSMDPNWNRPIVLLEFGRAGARAFGELTERIVGKKLATLLDGTIKSAPIINGPIRGGRASITMGGTDAAAMQRDADELALVLKTGALPAPLREVSADVVP